MIMVSSARGASAPHVISVREAETGKAGGANRRASSPSAARADPADAVGEGAPGTALRIAIEESQGLSSQARASRSTGTAGSA